VTIVPGLGPAPESLPRRKPRGGRGTVRRARLWGFEDRGRLSSGASATGGARCLQRKRRGCPFPIKPACVRVRPRQRGGCRARPPGNLGVTFGRCYMGMGSIVSPTFGAERDISYVLGAKDCHFVTAKHPLLASERIGLPQSSSFGRFSFVRGSIRLRSEAEPAAPPKSPKNKGVLGSYVTSSLRSLGEKIFLKPPPFRRVAPTLPTSLAGGRRVSCKGAKGGLLTVGS